MNTHIRFPPRLADVMKLEVLFHQAEEGGYWAKVAALPGCVTEGETLEEALANAREAAEGWLEVSATRTPPDPEAQLVEIELYCKALEPHGWTLQSIRGSHHIDAHRDNSTILTVPVHSNRDLKRETLGQILKAAELSEEDL